MTARIEPRIKVFADNGNRTITGVAVTYNVVGRGSIGPTKFAPGSIVVPDDVTRVKLFRDHRDRYGIGTPVGWLTHVDDTPDGLRVQFQVGEGPDGDQALADAQGVRDGLSIEIKGEMNRAPDGTVRRALLDAVALVPMPAFADARVQTVTYSETPDERTDMDPEQQTSTTDLDVTDPAAPQAQAAPAAPDADGGVPRAQPTTAPASTAAAAPAAPAAAFAASNARPVGITGIASRGPSFHEVADVIQATMAGESPSAAFALADITSSAFTPTVSQPGWLGELWDGIGYTRVIVPLVTSRALTHYRMTGWKWVEKAKVGKWAGDKTEIPTNTPSTEPANIDAERWAGGWDFDRKFIDFGDREFIASFLRSAAEDYALKTDTEVATDLVAGATAVAGTAPDMLRAVSRGAQAVRRARAGAPSFVLVNDADLESLLDFNNLDVPAFLGTLGISPESWVASDLVPAGSVIVGVKRGFEFYELPGSPIRVQALDLARGGIDHAVYGYTATHVVNAKAIAKVAWAKPVTP